VLKAAADHMYWVHGCKLIDARSLLTEVLYIATAVEHSSCCCMRLEPCPQGTRSCMLCLFVVH
jgi:hypothetical protein